MPEPTIDFAIITAIEIERRAVCDAFGMTKEDRIRSEARTYWRKRLQLEDGEFYYEILVAQSTGMGGIDITHLVSDTIQDWKPNAILLVGIAGAASKEQHLGDLVIASDVYYYEPGKLTPDGKKPEPYMFKADSTLWDRVITVADWITPISVDRPDGTQERPKIEHGVIASGEKVIADAAVRDRIAAGQRKIKAIEMEGYGFSAAIWQNFDKVHHLVIKAICDLADSSKNDEWQPYAAVVAADFTKHFLLDRPLEPQNPPAIKPLSGDKHYEPIYKPIIKAFTYGNVVPFLGAGIEPSIYIDLAWKLTQEVGPGLLEERWDSSDRNKMRQELIEKLIGLPSSGCHHLTLPTSTLRTEQELILAKMDLRFLSQYLHREINSSVFYRILSLLTTAMEDCRNEDTRQLYDFFAQLPKRMRPKLIVTTKYDTYLEQAFSLYEKPFDVVFYKVDAIEREDGRKEGGFMHKPYDQEQALLITDRDYDLPDDKRTIILQLYGRRDDNFVITQDDFDDLLQGLKKLPTDLRDILAENNILFLGYSPNDYELQVLVDRLFKENILTQRDFFRYGFTSWLIHQCQPGNIKTAIWEERRKIKLIDIQSTWKDFVSNLKTGIDQKIETMKREAG